MKEDDSPGKSGKPKDFNCEYQITLNVPSISVNDSRVNAARFEELNIMMAPRTEKFKGGKLNNKNINLRVLMSNLINNGSYKKSTTLTLLVLLKNMASGEILKTYLFLACLNLVILNMVINYFLKNIL